MKLSSKLLILHEGKVNPKELAGKKFKVIQTNFKKLVKRKTPFELEWKFERLMDKKGAFSFSYVDAIVKNKDGMYAILQVTPLSGEIKTILQEV